MPQATDPPASYPGISIAALTARICAEFNEFPEIRLTESQFRRLFALDDAACKAVLGALCDGGFLTRDLQGLYRKA